MRAPALNTPKHALVALLLAAGAVAPLGVGGCGGGSPSAQSLLNDTFRSHTPIASGRLELSLALSASGSSTAREPFSLHLTGPFQTVGSGQLPRFALQLTLATAGHTLHAGATSTGSQFFIELQGTPFLAPEGIMRAIQQGYAQASQTAGSAKSRSTFASLGIDPGRWLEHPVKAGTANLAGVKVVHLLAALNLSRFLQDAGKLSGAGGSLGLGGTGRASGPLSPALLSALSSSVRSARVDVYTGASDHLLRRLSLTAGLAATPQTSAVLGGLSSATLEFQVQFSELNQPQKIVAPSNPKPFSQLLGALQRLGLSQAGSSSTTPLRPGG